MPRTEPCQRGSSECWAQHPPTGLRRFKLVDEQIVIFQKGSGNVADISYFGTSVVTRVRHAIGEGEVKDVEECLSQLA
jgi:hypothetical protein